MAVTSEMVKYGKRERKIFRVTNDQTGVVVYSGPDRELATLMDNRTHPGKAEFTRLVTAHRGALVEFGYTSLTMDGAAEAMRKALDTENPTGPDIIAMMMRSRIAQAEDPEDEESSQAYRDLIATARTWAAGTT